MNYPLFDVWCTDDPETDLYQIGRIITTSDVVTSLYGDTKLFFRHVRFEEDIEKRPHWINFVQKFERKTFVELLPLPQDAPQSCPFDYLFGLM